MFASPAVIGLGRVVQRMENPRNYVIYIGEVAAMMAVIKYIDWLAACDFMCKQHGRHIRATPRAVDGEKTQAGRMNIKKTLSALLVIGCACACASQTKAYMFCETHHRYRCAKA